VKLPEMKTGLTVSALVHAALLLWGLISFAGRPLEAKPTDGMPVDIISDKQFSEMTKGMTKGAKDKPPAPLVEKVGDPKPVDDPTPKVTEKKELQTTKFETAPPPPAPAPESKPDPKQTKKEPPKPDAIAETLKKEEAKKKAEDQAKSQQQTQPTKPSPQFDPTRIAALLDKREAMRVAATGEVPNPSGSLGYVNGMAAQLSQSEIDALRERLKQCWNPPVGALDAGRLKIVLNVQFKPDGSVAAPPQVVAGSASSFGPAMAESATRAILTCQPFKMLKPEHYQQWKEIEITFDPREMFGG
jgi:outer membrane biosynthesis protein TonB